MRRANRLSAWQKVRRLPMALLHHVVANRNASHNRKFMILFRFIAAKVLRMRKVLKKKRLECFHTILEVFNHLFLYTWPKVATFALSKSEDARFSP